jgi:hypothetical protein
MPKNRKATASAVEILHRRYYHGKPERLADLDKARAEDELARKIYEPKRTGWSDPKEFGEAGWNDCVGNKPVGGFRL